MVDRVVNRVSDSPGGEGGAISGILIKWGTTEL